ncbi:MAG TPA: EAL domain-containing protein [Solimonas sp.]|nr:EAL domain-containing protein [Solimonas sp.]
MNKQYSQSPESAAKVNGKGPAASMPALPEPVPPLDLEPEITSRAFAVLRSVRLRVYAICAVLLLSLALGLLQLYRLASDPQAGVDVLQMAVGLMVGAVLAALLLMSVVLRRIVAPLRMMARALRRMSAGDLRVELPPVTPDELGDMSRALHHFQDQAQRARRDAYIDKLTGLPNRARLDEILRANILEALDGGQALALLFLDLDHFRTINETLGHGFGDRVLAAVGLRIRRLLPPGSLLAHYSGDEFAAVLPGLPNNDELPGLVRVVAEQVLRGMSEPQVLDNRQLSTAVSIGIALFPPNGQRADDLVSAADAALHQAKKGGRNQAHFASTELTVNARRRLELGADIRRGIEAKEFSAFFQPVVDVTTGQTVGAEALMRWRHHTRGLVSPAEFIPVAEQTGQMAMLNDTIFEDGARQAAAWAFQGRRIRLSVNLTAHELRDAGFLKRVEAMIAKHTLDPLRLEFEITEGVIMADVERNLRVLDDLRALGVRLSIDDFGTGYSSLSYVQRMPINKIKIDRSFVIRLGESREAEAIVVATLAMARSLSLEVVAEGVETIEQSSRLRELGCVLHQGFLFSKALPPAEFDKWTAARSKIL